LKLNQQIYNKQAGMRKFCAAAPAGLQGEIAPQPSPAGLPTLAERVFQKAPDSVE
jgi:hypothetical protein